MTLHIRLNTINSLNLLFIETNKPLAVPGPDVENHTVRLRDEGPDAGRAVDAKFCPESAPEAREPRRLETARREKSAKLQGQEERHDGAGQEGEREEEEVEGVDKVAEDLEGFG